MKLPFRKCYHAAKVGLFLIIVITILALYEQWRGGKLAARAATYDHENKYEKEILEDEARIIPGLGEGGVAAHLLGKEKRLGEESEKKLAINVYLSDRIAYNRTLKDYRNPACQRVIYDAELPSASVIIIFHNEPYSVVIRTIWSVVNSARRDNPWFLKANFVDKESGRHVNLGYPGQEQSSPFVYLKEIILVDDNSTLPELKGKLSHYVRTRLPPDLIRILRLPDRVGLTRARLAGARYATGDVLVFLDSHCEAQQDWLRPLLQRIDDFPHAVVVPIIDVIEASTFYYSVQDPVTFQIFKSLPVHERFKAGIPNLSCQGLILARISGARVARGDVLVFLDAHCEVSHDWLRPLLQRISHKRDTVLTPLIDVLDQTTFKLEAAQQFQVGGFTFVGHFTWIDVPEREKKRRGSDIAPTWSPTMAGGLFAINRQYYWELGAYDEQMAGWGGENLEMSFRIWQCGGTLETVPCSRVGHVFRSFHPYGLPAQSDTHGINTARMAEVWMDDYAELFYLHRPDLRKNPKIGDVTHRKVLREKLKCKSFQWYLDNIYKEKFVPVRDVFGFGRFMNPASGTCLDTLQRDGEAVALGQYPCHGRLEPTQHLALSLAGELRDEEMCAEVKYERNPLGANKNEFRRVLMVTCHGKQRGQHWRYLPTQQLQHTESRLCLQSTGITGADVVVARCQKGSAQVWLIDYSELNEFRMNDQEEKSEQEIKLQKLRGQRRISRSLLSVSRRKTKKHRKNKFILKLVRNSSEHLEMDVYCKHRRLLPNDTFVRDLVTILNDKDIKVINNGRVFERHKVSELKHVDTPSTLAPDIPDTHDSPDIHDILTTMSDIDPVEVEPKPHKKRKRKKHRPRQIARDTHTDIEGQTDKQPAKKIIIEDFVEVKPLDAVTRRVKTRKRTRRTKLTTKMSRVGDDWDDSMRMEGSMEESPMAEKDVPWSGASLRRTSSQVPEAQSAPRPVKLMMKSNVTLKLGDEFFAWRKHGQTADDVADILGELIIPDSIRGSETETTERETESEKDVLLTGKGPLREGSSSEESGGGD